MIPLMKRRPNFVPLILSALMSWHRAPPPGLNPTQVRSVIRIVKVALLNARRYVFFFAFHHFVMFLIFYLGLVMADLSFVLQTSSGVSVC